MHRILAFFSIASLIRILLFKINRGVIKMMMEKRKRLREKAASMVREPRNCCCRQGEVGDFSLFFLKFAFLEERENV